VISLEVLTLLLENATEDSVEVAISFLKECGQKLTEVSPRGINGGWYYAFNKAFSLFMTRKH
jgi:pre-mRNA-splicing factor CWC22